MNVFGVYVQTLSVGKYFVAQFALENVTNSVFPSLVLDQRVFVEEAYVGTLVTFVRFVTDTILSLIGRLVTAEFWREGLLLESLSPCASQLDF